VKKPKSNVEARSFEAGYGKAVECISKVAAALPGGVPEYCKGGAMAHLSAGYAMLHSLHGPVEAIRWLRAVLDEAAADMTKVVGSAVKIVAETKGGRS
jgi:hypothetical protein